MKVLDDEFLLLHEVEVVAEFPHDLPDAFTQGLFMREMMNCMK